MLDRGGDECESGGKCRNDGFKKESRRGKKNRASRMRGNVVVKHILTPL